MVVLARIDWIHQHVLAGSDVQYSCSHDTELNRTKVRFTARYREQAAAFSPLLCDVLNLLRASAQTHTCTDADHRHSSGTSVATFGAAGEGP